MGPPSACVEARCEQCGTDDKPIFTSVIIITDRRVLDDLLLAFGQGQPSLPSSTAPGSR
jgi:hypothetical protein